LEPKGEAFSDEDISTFKERFSLAGNFNLKYLEKKYLEKYSLLVYSAIESEEWRSYRPFISSEIDGMNLTIQIYLFSIRGVFEKRSDKDEQTELINSKIAYKEHKLWLKNVEAFTQEKHWRADFLFWLP